MSHVASRAARTKILAAVEANGQLTAMESIKLLYGPSVKKQEEK